jgi:D-alanyl-D-alanine endopeptidase (penicillin-binding protein 7)
LPGLARLARLGLLGLPIFATVFLGSSIAPLGISTSEAAVAPRTASRARPASRRPGRKRTGKATTSKRAVLLERKVPSTRGGLPNVQALGSLVVDLDNGEELFARRPDQARPIASISKLLAALVVVGRGLALEDLTTIKKVDAEVARGGAPSRLLEGMTLSNRDLLHAALMGSDNRAVAALGRAVGLNATQLAAAMSKQAAALGLKQTRFREPTGLSPENVASPRETIAMLRAAMAHPVIAPIMQKTEYDAHPVARPAVKYITTHRPAHRANTQILAGKTGYNDAARYCLVIAARVGGRQLGMAFLGTEGKLTRFGDVARTADWVIARKPRPAPALARSAAPPDGHASPAPGSAPPAGAPVSRLPGALENASPRGPTAATVTPATAGGPGAVVGEPPSDPASAPAPSVAP